MAEVVHTLSVGGGSPHYTSRATLESDLNTNNGSPAGGPSWAAPWADNHVIEVIHAGSGYEVSGRLAISAAMNGKRLIVRPYALNGISDHAGKATNAIAYDNTKGACWKDATGDYCFLSSATGRVTIQGMQIKATGGAVAAIRLYNDSVAAEIEGCIIECDGTQAVLISPWNVTTALVRKNVIVSTGSGSHGLSIEGGASYTFDVTDNTIRLTGAAGSSVGIKLVSGSLGGTLYNNNLSGFNTDCSWTPTSGSHNATDKSSGSGLPSTNRVDAFVAADNFVNASTNLRLKTGGSPSLINAGTASFGSGTDLLGETRPSGSAKDIGAVEYIEAAVAAAAYRMGNYRALVMHTNLTR